MNTERKADKMRMTKERLQDIRNAYGRNGMGWEDKMVIELIAEIDALGCGSKAHL